MLSTNSTSSIDKRRQFHRRQQSLEVPIVAPQLPANSRRAKRPNGHQRGLSLDQSLSALHSSALTSHSPIGFRPLLPQEHEHDQGPHPPVRIQLDTTNIGHSPNQQHYKQETQQHRPAQPGFPAHNFQTHLQQQLNGHVHASPIFSPQPTHPHQQQALQDLQQHMEWYQQNYVNNSGTHSPNPDPNMNGFNFIPSDQPIPHEVAVNPAEVAMRLANAITQTPVSHGHGHSHTVPNTPQHCVQHWPSPPPTNVKHARSQSFQLDVAPMPTSPAPGHIIATSTPSTQQRSFNQGSFDFGSDPIYSSSNVDPLSPGRQQNFGTMPTLFEESTHGGLTDDALLLQVTASDDFNSPNFLVGGPIEGMSPHSALLAGLGDDVNCSIVDTGITDEQVDACISEQHPQTKLWYCLCEVNGEICNNESKRRENCRSHVQNHLGDRKFMCNDCGKTFVRAHDMKRHAAIHKDDRPHVCPCNQSFARADVLTRHRQRGMCMGTLPGFEKTEEEKPKRGRPKKKDRPDNETRTAKAKKARQMDRENAAGAATADFPTTVGAMHFNYASSSSAISDFSLPMTPPNDDFDPDAFLNLANADYTASSSWRDTPPTSPVAAHPGVVRHMDIFSDAMTPESDPTIASSPLTCDGAAPEMFGGDWSKLAYDQDKGLVDLEHWISTH